MSDGSECLLQVSGEKEFFANLVVDAVSKLDPQTLDLRMIGIKKVGKTLPLTLTCRAEGIDGRHAVWSSVGNDSVASWDSRVTVAIAFVLTADIDASRCKAAGFGIPFWWMVLHLRRPSRMRALRCSLGPLTNLRSCRSTSSLSSNRRRRMQR
jgi:hypothetical protein